MPSKNRCQARSGVYDIDTCSSRHQSRTVIAADYRMWLGAPESSALGLIVHTMNNGRRMASNNFHKSLRTDSVRERMDSQSHHDRCRIGLFLVRGVHPCIYRVMVFCSINAIKEVGIREQAMDRREPEHREVSERLDYRLTKGGVGRTRSSTVI